MAAELECYERIGKETVLPEDEVVMRKIIAVGFFLLTVCVSVAIAQPIKEDQATAEQMADETFSSQPAPQFGPFEFHGEQGVTTVRFIPENGDYVLCLICRKKSEDYLIENVYKIVGDSGEGLLIVGFLGPNAPPCGPEFKVLGFNHGKIKALAKNIIMCGYLVEKTISPENDTIRLSEHNILTAAFSDSNYFVIVPFKVDFKNSTLFPVKNSGEFSVEYNKEQDMNMGFGNPAIDLYSSRDLLSKKSSIRSQEVKTFDVLGVYASVKMQDASPFQSEIVISDKAIKVRINGMTYWLNEKDKWYLGRLGVGVFD